jgi:hypothetical protein
MKVYFAGNTGTLIREKMVINKTRARLLSFFYMDKKLSVKDGLDYIVKKKKQ